MLIFPIESFGGSCTVLYFPLTDTALPTGVSVARSTVGWRWTAARELEQVGINLPRFDHDPATGALRGLLFEPGMTNEAPQPRAMNDATYTRFQLQAVGAGSINNDPNQVSADGSSFMDFVCEDGTVNEHRLTEQLAIPRNVTCTSIIVAKGTNRSLSFRTRSAAEVQGHVSNFHLFGGNVGTVSTSIQGSPPSTDRVSEIAALPNGLYFCRHTEQNDNSSTADRQFLPRIYNGSSASYDGDGVSGIWLDYFAVFRSKHLWSYCEGTRAEEQLDIDVSAHPAITAWDIVITTPGGNFGVVNVPPVAGTVTVHPDDFPGFSDQGHRHVTAIHLTETQPDLMVGPQ